jgi:SAM-dependent methyltransferase
VRLDTIRRAATATVVTGALGLATGLVAPGAAQIRPELGQPGKDVLWLPTPPGLVGKMLDMANVTAQDVVMDLGSGDGRLVIAAAKRGARAIGVEYNRDLVDLSRKNAAAQQVSDRARFVQADLFETDLRQATVITMFLRSDLNLKLRPTLLNLSAGTRIVSNTFTMGDWEPDDFATAERPCAHWCTAMLWIVPARVEGTWRLPDGELTLRQTFQMVDGTIRRGGVTTPIANGRLRGDEIVLTADGAQYRGRITGRTIEGTVSTRGAVLPWTATRVSGTP